MMVWTRVVCAPALMAIHSEKRTPQPPKKMIAIFIYSQKPR